MLALIMAGGAGTRLGMGEKPLVTLAGRPMLQYVTDAFIGAGHEILIVVSDNVPMTKNWCRAGGFEFFNASGAGYVEDLIECIIETGEQNPFFSCVSDMPGLTPGVIEEVLDNYNRSSKPALSVWIPEKYLFDAGCTPTYSETVGGCSACPVGLNILDGSLIEQSQEESRLLLERPELAFNVNCRKDLDSFLNFIEKL